MPLWNEIEGESLDGLPLKRLLRSEGRTAWFSTTDPDQQPGVLSVFEALNDEESVQARLETAAHVTHPNLMSIRGTGVARLDDESLVYAVMEPFDQTLSEVLRDRLLTSDEGREVAECLLSALETVEAAGLYHGHVDASGVLAVGDAIKLRSDCLTQRQGQTDAPGLAALIFTALTGRRFANERDAIQLPAPFATFVRAGAANNGSLMAMRRVLGGTSPASTNAVPTTVPAAPAPSVPVKATPQAPEKAIAAKPAAAASDLAQPAPRSTAAGIPRVALGELEEPTSRRPGVAIAALVLMAILLFAFWYFFKRPQGHSPISGEASAPASSTPETATAPPQPAATPAEPSAPPPSKPSAARSAAAPPARSPKHAPPAQSAAENAPNNASAAPSPAGDRNIWRVVAYTYNREEAAQRKATELAGRYPQLEPQVFSPSGHAPFLVVLGGGTDRQGAFVRREAARAAGMPSDTYAQNFHK